MIKKNWGCVISALLSPLVFAICHSQAPAQAEPELLTQTKIVSTDTNDNSVLKVGETRSQSMVRSQDAITRIHPHTHNGRNAATVYVRNIPVLTLLDQGQALGNQKSKTSSLVKLPSSSDPLPANSLTSADPVERATAIAALINQFSRDGLDAKEIVPSFESGNYVIKLGKQSTLKFDRGLVYSDTVRNQANDVLQATNLLRRLVGNAAPVSTIANAPSPSRSAARIAANPVVGQAAQFASGFASWYGPGFHGAMSASGEIFNANALTAAHRSLPFGTQVKVTNMDNGRSVVVRINDRGPFTHNRVLDISEAAARVIGLINSGVAPVRMEVMPRN